MKIILLIFLVSICFFIKEILNPCRCCGDCENYKNCHGDSLARNDIETPACKNFKERIYE